MQTFLSSCRYRPFLGNDPATEERAQLFGGFLKGLDCRFFVFDYRGYGLNDGQADESVPYWMGCRLYELAPEPKTFVAFPGAGHQELRLEIMIPAVRS